MTIADSVKVTQHLACAEDIADYAKVRTRFLGDALLLVVDQLVWPEFLVEVEVTARRRNRRQSLDARPGLRWRDRERSRHG
jgi:hypothetical protein